MAVPTGAPHILLLSAAHPPDDIRVVRKEGAALAAAGWRVRHLAPAGPAPTADIVDGVSVGTYRRRPGWRARVLGIAADAVVVAKDGLDADFAAPGRTVRVRNYAMALPVRPRRHGPGPVTLAHVGALGRSRGWPQMLDALALAPPGTRLRLVGRFTDGSEAGFVAEAAALGLAERIERLPWMPPGDALARLAECDIGLVLFQPGHENHRLALPHKLFDCMLAGLPVIAPGFGPEVAGVVREAGCGLLVDSASPAAIAAAVVELADPARRTALGAAGRDAALTRYGWEGEAARLVALYRRLLPT